MMTKPPITENSRVNSVLAATFILLGLMQVVPAVVRGARDRTVDIARQWVVVQYMIRGANPYPVALAAYQAQFGILAPRGTVHLRDLWLWAAPKTGPHPQTDPVIGPPEATYPPGTIVALMPLGFLSREAVRGLWLLLNLALLPLVARELASYVSPGNAHFWFFFGLVFVWPATSYCIGAGQFSLLCLAALLEARRSGDRHPIAAGLLYSLAMLKPTLTLPFLFLPVLERRLKTLASLVVSQLVLLGAASLLVHTNPLSLIQGWSSVGSYHRGGMYNIQELINALRLDGTVWDIPVELGVLLAAGTIAYWMPPATRVALLAVISCIWTYHGNYDFVTLLIPAALLAAAPMNGLWTFATSALIAGGLGLSESVYLGPGELARGLRWGARAGFVALAAALVLSGFKLRRSGPTMPAPLDAEELRNPVRTRSDTRNHGAEQDESPTASHPTAFRRRNG